LARLAGLTGRVGELESRGSRVRPEDTGVGELDSSLGGLYERWTTTPLTYTLIGLSGLGGAGGTEEDKTLSVVGCSGDELRGSSGYVHGIVASEEKLYPGSEKTSGTARLGEDHDRVADDGVGCGGLDEARKRVSLR
jgi:hypothetical protein